MSTNGFHLDLQVIVIFTVDCTFSNEYMKKNYFFLANKTKQHKNRHFLEQVLVHSTLYKTPLLENIY